VSFDDDGMVDEKALAAEEMDGLLAAAVCDGIALCDEPSLVLLFVEEEEAES